MFVRYALGMRNLAVAQQATELAPLDPQAHRARAALLTLTNSTSESLMELEKAVALRPADYSLWLALGQLRDQAGDSQGALAALNEAVRRAPFYARPRWQRGNVLLRTGQYEAGFSDLNLAAQSDPELIPNIIDLAWGLTKGDPALTEQLVSMNNQKTRLAFASFLARKGKAAEAIAQFRLAGAVPDAFKRELIAQLLAKDAFQEAFEIWKETHGTDQFSGEIYDGGFEAPLLLKNESLGWHVDTDTKTATLSLDASQPHSGSKSLRIDFGGDSLPGWPLLSQVILVQPSKRYRVNFAFRSQDVVTGGLPVAIVTDASGDKDRLGQSIPLRQSSADWQVLSFAFTTNPTTTAVILSLQRENCATSPCPIFGSITLDSFSLEQLN